MDLTNLLAVAVPMAAAIAIFFWSLDRIRKERVDPADGLRTPRATPRELVERLLRPAAENLSLRRSAEGKPTLSEDLARAGVNITPAEYLLIRIGAVALGALIGLFRFGISIGPIVIAALDFVIPPLVVNYLQRRRQNMFNDQLTGMLQLLSNSLKTGYAIDRALETVASKSQPPVSTEVERVTTEITLGTSVEDALSALLLRINSPDLEFIVTAILLHTRVGGNLAEVLDNISDTLRDRLQTKRDMSVLTAQSRASASIITGLPILLGLGLYVFVPGYFAPMTSTVVGYILLGIAGLLILIGNILIRRMTALKPARTAIQVRQKLSQAGNPGGLTPAGFQSVRYSVAAIMAVAGLAVGLVVPVGMPTLLAAAVSGLIFAVIGFMTPGLWIEQRIAQRRREIQRSLAEATDLLTLVVESGMSLDEGLLSITERFHNALGDEIGKVLREIRLGRPRMAALEHMADMCGVPDLHHLVESIVQS